MTIVPQTHQLGWAHWNHLEAHPRLLHKSQILRNVKSLFKKTGVFDIDIRKFDRLPTAQKTYEEFQRRLTIAWNEYQDDVRNGVGNAGFNNANMATQMEQFVDQVNAATAQTNEAIQQMATQAVSDKKQIELLTQLVNKLLNAKTNTSPAPTPTPP